MHGITVVEAATNVVALRNADSAIPCVIGTAPVHLGTVRDVGRPVIAYTYEEAAAQLGYSDDWKTYTLCEAMHVLFRVFGVTPVVFINVMDAKKHTEKVTNAQLDLTDATKPVIRDSGILLDTLKIGAYTQGTHYTAKHNAAGYVEITPIDAEITDGTSVEYSKLDPDSVAASDVLGGYDSETGTSTGIELVDDVYHVCGVTPATLLAPGWSHVSLVADALAAKAKLYDSAFSAIAAVDIGVDEPKYAAVAEESRDTADTYVVQCWPCAPVDETRVAHRSTIFAGMCASTDADYAGIPYASPSNRYVPLDGLCLEDGTTLSLNYKQANAVENAGVYTAVRLDTWKAWGTYTSAVNASGDPKDIFIAVRRMMNWHKNTFVLNYFQKIDNPADTRLVESLIDSENKRIDGLKNIGAVAGGRMYFLAEDNPVGNLMAGKLRFRQKLGFWVPAREIENIIEIDAELLRNALGGE